MRLTTAAVALLSVCARMPRMTASVEPFVCVTNQHSQTAPRHAVPQFPSDSLEYSTQIPFLPHYPLTCYRVRCLRRLKRALYLARSKKESVVSLLLLTLSSPRLLVFRAPAPTPGLMMKARATPIPEAISVVTRK